MKKKLFHFTILELLIVISVMVILISLLLPALTSVKEKTKSIHCLSNLKQSGLAMINYTNDYNGFLMTNYSSPYTKWYTPLIRENFISSQNVIGCPAAPDKPNYEGNSGNGVYGSWFYQNYVMLHKMPSARFLLADSTHMTYTDYRQYYWVNIGSVIKGTVYGRHFNKGNLFFVDGSARTLTRYELQNTPYNQTDLQVYTTSFIIPFRFYSE
ncbi:MAG: hypothetical protein A2017_12140 [Lentisphaerae bacterium GWF2_44_16]|nr:MAG: hypothetical protein A2017_12140 [Lentisphaerae bacterium GWF2_44_16]